MPTSSSNRDDPRLSDAGEYRDAVDRGRTGDKIPARDPAAAPVHTDAEAGGRVTPRPESAAATRSQASHAPPEQVRATHTNPGRGQLQIPGRSMAWFIALGFAALILIGIVAALVTLP